MVIFTAINLWRKIKRIDPFLLNYFSNSLVKCFINHLNSFYDFLLKELYFHTKFSNTSIPNFAPADQDANALFFGSLLDMLLSKDCHLTVNRRKPWRHCLTFGWFIDGVLVFAPADRVEAVM